MRDEGRERERRRRREGEREREREQENSRSRERETLSPGLSLLGGVWKLHIDLVEILVPALPREGVTSSDGRRSVDSDPYLAPDHLWSSLVVKTDRGWRQLVRASCALFL